MKAPHLFVVMGLSLMAMPMALALESPGPAKAVTVLKTQSSWDGKPIQYPAGQAEVTGMVVEIAAGGETAWHLHPVPSVAMILEGELEVQLKDGSLRRLKAGECVTEVVNTLHKGRNVGTVPVKLVVFYMGSLGQTLSVEEASR